MRSFIRMLIANLATVAGCTMFVVLPAYLEKCGLARTQIGLADGCFWIISVFIQPFLGHRLDRFGPKPFMLLGSALMALVAAVFHVLPIDAGQFPAVMLLRALQGAGFAIYLTSSWTWVAGHVDPARRGAYFGYFGISSLLAGIIGPAVGEVVGDDYRKAFLIGSCCMAAGLLNLLTLSGSHSEVHEEHHESELHFLGLFRLPEMRSTAFGALGFGLAVGSLFAFAAAYIRQLHISGITVTFAFITLASGFARVWTGRLADRYGPASIILPSLILLALGCMGLSSLVLCGSMAFAILCLAGTSAGLGYGAVYPALNGLAVERLPRAAKGKGLCLVAASIDLGNTAGASLAGIVADKLGYSEMFLVIGLAVMASCVLFCVSERSVPGKACQSENGKDTSSLGAPL